MLCPECRRSTQVRLTRPHQGLVVRLRVCVVCGKQWRTEERCIVEVPQRRKQPNPMQRKEERQLWHSTLKNKID